VHFRATERSSIVPYKPTVPYGYREHFKGYGCGADEFEHGYGGDQCVVAEKEVGGVRGVFGKPRVC
jgi:hypothetical protein